MFSDYRVIFGNKYSKGNRFLIPFLVVAFLGAKLPKGLTLVRQITAQLRTIVLSSPRPMVNTHPHEDIYVKAQKVKGKKFVFILRGKNLKKMLVHRPLYATFYLQMKYTHGERRKI